MEAKSEKDSGDGWPWSQAGSLPVSGAALSPTRPPRMGIRDWERCELTATVQLGTLLYSNLPAAALVFMMTLELFSELSSGEKAKWG